MTRGGLQLLRFACFDAIAIANVWNRFEVKFLGDAACHSTALTLGCKCFFALLTRVEAQPQTYKIVQLFETEKAVRLKKRLLN